MESTVDNQRQENDDHKDPKKESSGSCLNPAARAIKKLTFDSFVLTHFFLVFLVSFVVGILFLHSAYYTFWDHVEEVDLNKVLEDLGVNKLASFVNSGTIDDTAVKQLNDTFT